VGIVLVTAIAWIVYGQKLNAVALLGMALIIAGAAILNLRGVGA
jgi:multidrug transporter EmrE-like cation transporter